MFDVLTAVNDGLNNLFDEARENFLKENSLSAVPPIEKKAKKKRSKRAPSESFRRRCPSCGFKIRGAHHAEGAHHKGTVK